MQLSRLQRDILLILRDASGDLGEIEEITEGYVARLLDSHCVPLGSLVDALADMEKRVVCSRASPVAH